MPRLIPVPRKLLPSIRVSGLPVDSGYPVCGSVADALEISGPEDAILIFESDEDLFQAERGDTVINPSVFVNLNPYLPPRSITAGGGYILRDIDEERHVLMIYRRGCWDLPKGKRDDDESPVETAVREVMEETGIPSVNVLRSLGKTRHSYLLKKYSVVKTTFWFLMTTESDTFEAQALEDIEQVAWIPLREAPAKVGYISLSKHMARVSDLLKYTPLKSGDVR